MKNNKIQLIILILLGLFLTACGSQKIAQTNNSIDLSSRDTSNQTRNARTNGKLADCNNFKYPSQNLSGLLTSSYIPGTSNVDTETIRLRLIDFPSQIRTSNSYKLEIYLWGEDTPGNIVDSDTPTKFYFQNIFNGTIISSQHSEISKPVIQQIIDTIYSYKTNYTIAQFIKDHIILLQNVSIQYDAISLALYPKSGGEALAFANFLIPQFYADPNVYANTHSSSQLQELHPNYNLKNNFLSEDAYFQKTEDFCEKFRQQNPTI